MDFQHELEKIRKIREEKYSKSNSDKIKNIAVYNYNNRKDMLDYIKKCSKLEIIRERMDKNEKQDYRNKISKICCEDLEYFNDIDIKTNTNLMIDLFKYNFNLNVLKMAYSKYSLSPHIQMIKELLSKPKLSEDFLIKIITDYTNTNKNYINLLIYTDIFSTQYVNAIEIILNLFYSDSNTSITFEQIKMIYSKTNVTPDKLKFMIIKCSNITGYSKCSKTFAEKPVIDLIKILVRDTEKKYKCKIDIDLYTLV